MILLKEQWRSDRWTLLTWCLLVVFLMWLVGAMNRMLIETGVVAETEEMIRMLPPAVRALITVEAGTLVAGMAYGGIMPIAFIVFLATYVPGLISREIDRRNAEFLLALPVRRQSVLLSKWTGLATSLAILALVQWASLMVMGAGSQPIPYLWATANMYLLYLAAGTLLLLASLFIDDYPKSAGVSAGIVTTLFFVNTLTAETTGRLASLRKYLLFARFDSGPILAAGKVPWADMLVLAASTLALLYLAIRAFDAKQIAG